MSSRNEVCIAECSQSGGEAEKDIRESGRVECQAQNSGSSCRTRERPVPGNNQTRPEPRCSTGVESGTKPYQSHPTHIETQKLSKRVLYFQEKWFQEYTWPHYNPQVKVVLCFYCNKVFTDSRSSFGNKVDAAFVTEGLQLEEGFR